MPTWAELDILACLWGKDATAVEIVNELADYYEYEFAPTTILTVLNTLSRPTSEAATLRVTRSPPDA